MPIVVVRRGPRTASGAITAEQDWINRSTQADVTMKTDFRGTNDVSTYTFPNGDASYVSRDTSNKITGNASLLIDVPSTQAGGAPAWTRPVDDTFTTTSQGIGHTDFWMQKVMLLGPNRLTPSNGGGGFKIFILGGFDITGGIGNSNSHTDNEFVISTYNWAIPSPYFETGNGTPPLWEANGGGGDLFLQPAADLACTYNNLPSMASCWQWPVGTPFTVMTRVRYATFGGSSGNQMDLYVHQPGWAGYLQLFASRNFALGNDAVKYVNGPNGIWLTPYDTGRIDSTVNTYHRYYQVVCSRSFIDYPRAYS